MPIREGMKHMVAKLSIGSLDDSGLEVTAHYNPAQLEIGRTAQWKPHGSDNRAARFKTDQRAVELEYTGGENRTLSLELLFDGFETNTCVEPILEMLDEMASAVVPEAKDPEQRRPHHCVIVWGEGGIRPLPCAIESVSVKYTMFARDGRPLRATATIKVREMATAKPVSRTPKYVEWDDDFDNDPDPRRRQDYRSQREEMARRQGRGREARDWVE